MKIEEGKRRRKMNFKNKKIKKRKIQKSNKKEKS